MRAGTTKTLKVGTQKIMKSMALLIAFTGPLALAQTAETTATSTTTAETLKVPVANKFGLTLANETSTTIDTTRTKGGADTLNLISISYQAQENLKLAATMVGEYSFVGRGEDQSKQVATYRDLSLSASTTHGGFLGTEKTPVKYIFNLPTSKLSIEEKRAFSVGAEVTLGYELTESLSSNIFLAPGWILKNGSQDEVKNQINAELRFAHTGKLSTYGFLDHKIKTKVGGPLGEKIKEVAAIGAGVSYSPNKILDLDMNISRDRHIANSASQNKSLKFAFFDTKEISYTASAVVKF